MDEKIGRVKNLFASVSVEKQDMFLKLTILSSAMILGNIIINKKQNHLNLNWNKICRRQKLLPPDSFQYCATSQWFTSLIPTSIIEQQNTLSRKVSTIFTTGSTTELGIRWAESLAELFIQAFINSKPTQFVIIIY